MGDHDKLFWRAFSVPANAAGQLRSVLPAGVSARIDFSELAMLPASFVDAEMTHRHGDLLFRAPIAGAAGADCYLYVLLEHQSQADPLMAWRVFTYLQRIWAKILRDEPMRVSLPPLISVVAFHGAGGWTAPRRLHELIDGIAEIPEIARLIPDFELLIDDLGAASDEDLRSRPLAPFPRVVLWLLRDGRKGGAVLERLAAWGDELGRLRRADLSGEDSEIVLRYIVRVAGEIPAEALKAELSRAAPELEDVMATFEEQIFQKGIEQGLEQGIEQGLEQGIEQGVQRGRAEALRESLARLLRVRFGSLDERFERRLGDADADDLSRWIERVVTADSPGDVFDP